MYRVIKIEPSRIDVSRSSTFRFRYILPHEGGSSEADEELVRSIKSLGIINPPILLTGYGENQEGLTVLDGHRRISAAISADFKEIEALLIEKPQPKPVLAKIWLEGALSGNPPTELEKVILADRCTRLDQIPFGEVLNELGLIFGRKVSEDYLKSLLRVLEGCERCLLACHHGEIRADELLKLITHPAIDEEKVCEILGLHRFTSKEKREFLLLIELMAGKAPDKINEVLDMIKVQSASAEESIYLLRLSVYPTLEKLKGEMEELIKNLKLPKYATIQYPENLEGSQIKFTIRIRRSEELKLVTEKLTGAIQSGTIERLLSILNGSTEEDGT